MIIKETMRHNFGGFALDTDSISNTTNNKTKIKLPYTGALPADLDNASGAAIIITICVGLTVNVLLTVEREGKENRYPIEATPEEIDKILQAFFFDGSGHTRRDNGLEPYSLGLHQGSYINWQRLTLKTDGLDNLLSQLAPAVIERILQHIEHSRQTA